MITQRDTPRLALVRHAARRRHGAARAGHAGAARVAGRGGTPSRARVWDDEVKAYDMGALAAQWFSDFLGQPARLVRFDPEQKRLSTGAGPATSTPRTPLPTAFPCW
jgi:uncharacterized protein YcbX